MFQVSKRDLSIGKAFKLRKSGMVPMVLIERDHSSMLLQAPIAKVRKALRETDSHGQLDIQVDGEAEVRRAMIKHVESDAMAGVLLTMTLVEVSPEDQLRLDLPVVATGSSPEVESGLGVISAVTDHLKVKGMASLMPEQIEVDISHLKAGDHIAAREIRLPAGLTLVGSPDATVFTCQHFRSMMPMEDTAAEVEAEVTNSA